MPESSTAATAPQDEERIRTMDDTLTIVAISIVAGTVANVLHEGVGHGLTALRIGAKSGVLTTVAWSSASDTPLVAAGGTLVNLSAALVFWLALRSVKLASMPMRYFLLIACAFNLFSGTGYFFFSGVTNFGDWQQVIAGTHPYWLWRTMLIVFSMAASYRATRCVGASLVRYLGVAPSERTRFRRLTWTPYFAAILIELIADLRNPLGL